MKVQEQTFGITFNETRRFPLSFSTVSLCSSIPQLKNMKSKEVYRYIDYSDTLKGFDFVELKLVQMNYKDAKFKDALKGFYKSDLLSKYFSGGFCCYLDFSMDFKYLPNLQSLIPIMKNDSIICITAFRSHSEISCL